MNNDHSFHTIWCEIVFKSCPFWSQCPKTKFTLVSHTCIIHVRSIEAGLRLKGTFNTEAADRTNVASSSILRVRPQGFTLTEETPQTISSHSTQTSCITELSRVTSHTVFNALLAPVWLVGSFGALYRRWSSCRTIATIWAVCAVRLV